MKTLLIIVALFSIAITANCQTFFKVPSTRMEPTIKWNEIVQPESFKTLKRFDIVTFRVNYRGENIIMLGRIIGLPGDVVSMRKPKLFINDIEYEEPFKLYYGYEIRLKNGVPGYYLEKLGFNDYSLLNGNLSFLVHSDKSKIDEIKQNINIDTVKFAFVESNEDFLTETYPLNKFTMAKYGPVPVPKKGQTFIISPEIYEILRNLIGSYESIPENGNFVSKNDYYFILCDNRDNSIDSRVIGCVPIQNITGLINK